MGPEPNAVNDDMLRTIADIAAGDTRDALNGLAIQYVRDRETAGVVVLTDDQPAKMGIENAV